ncbi:MAG: ABC transporter permease [Anaerolineales bacterium]
MGQYILRRIMINIPVLFVITVLVFTMVELAPGDMVDFFVTEETMSYLTEEDLNDLREKLGLNDPPPIRYLKWMGKLFQGDFGFSYIESYPVGPLLFSRIKNSMILMGTGLAIAILFGIPLGIYTALRQYSAIDFTLTGLSFVALSMPAFISGIVGMYIFAVKLGWFPAGGMRTPGVHTLPDLLHHLILPASLLALMHAGRFMRYQRFSMLEVLNQDYVVTATAKGMRHRIVINRHALRNALIPVVTIIGLTFSQFVTGAVFLETIYSWPGMGRLYYNAVIARDYPIIMGANLLIAIFVLAANLITDITYALVDPRVRFE